MGFLWSRVCVAVAFAGEEVCEVGQPPLAGEGRRTVELRHVLSLAAVAWGRMIEIGLVVEMQ